MTAPEDEIPSPPGRMSLAAAGLGLGLTLGLCLWAVAYVGTVAERRLEKGLERSARLISERFRSVEMVGQALADPLRRDPNQLDFAASLASGLLEQHSDLLAARLYTGVDTGNRPGHAGGPDLELERELRSGDPSIELEPLSYRARLWARLGEAHFDLRRQGERIFGQLSLGTGLLGKPDAESERARYGVVVVDFELDQQLLADLAGLDHASLVALNDSENLSIQLVDRDESSRRSTQSVAQFSSNSTDFQLTGTLPIRLGELNSITWFLALGGGLLLTALAFFATRSLETRHAEIHREVKRRTRLLRREVAEREEAEQRFDDITRAVGEYVFETDQDGAYTFLTGPIEDLFGVGAADALGRTPLDFVADEDVESAANELDRARKTATPILGLEMRVQRSDGEMRWIRQNAFPIFDDRDRLAGFRGAGLDVTETKLSTEKLEGHRRELQEILDALPAYVFYKDDKNNILRLNSTAAESLGASVEEIEGRSTSEFFSEEISEKYFADDLEVIRSGTPKLGILERFEMPGGERRFIRTDKIPLTGLNGDGTLVAIVEDITELRVAEQRLSLALRASGLGLWTWDLRSGTFELSDEWFTLLGHDPYSFPPVFESWQGFAHPDDRDRMREHFDSHLRLFEPTAGDRLRFEVRMRDASGQYRWILTIGEITDRDETGHPLHITGVQIDIEDLKQAEASLERARSLAEAANRAKSEFLANMSHEIRTPMSAILGFAEILRTEQIDEQQTDGYLETIQRNGQHLLSLINDILDLSKIESGRMELESISIDPRQVVDGVLELMRPRAVEKNLDLRMEIAPDLSRSLVTDPVRLKQILVNLMGNAIKFTESGSVTLRVRTEGENEDVRLLCAVQDTGIGMNQTQMERIFQPFSQADNSTTRRFGGTGLGLTISRRLARMLGGELSVTSEIGSGSTFRLVVAGTEISPDTVQAEFDAWLHSDSTAQLTESVDAPLPTDKPSWLENDMGSSTASEAPLAGARILLAEDGADNQVLLRHVLTRAGATLEIVGDGQAAADRLLFPRPGDEQIELLLLDMQMPRLDGYQTAELLRKEGQQLPIVALTAHAMLGDRERCTDAGCDDYATKPVDRAQLIATCVRWLGRGSIPSRDIDAA